MKRNLLLGSVAVIVLVAVVGTLLLFGSPGGNVQVMPTAWVFKFKGNYSGNYIGAINYYNDTNTYRSFMTLPIDEIRIKALSGGYYYMIMPNSKGMAKRTAVFDKNIPKTGGTSFGDSPEMTREEFYKYVIEEHPFTELYFCVNATSSSAGIPSELSSTGICRGYERIELEM